MAKQQTKAELDGELFETTPVNQATSTISGDGSALSDEAPKGGFYIDFTKIESGQTTVPAGMYNASIVGAQAMKSKNDNPMIRLRWKIEDGEFEGRVIWDNLIFMATTLWRVRQFLEAIGYPAEYAGNIEPESLIGESATLKLTVKTDAGINPETQEPYPARNNIQKYMPVGSARTIDDLIITE